MELRSLRPVHIGTVLESVAKTSRIPVLDENLNTGGIVPEVTARIQQYALDDLDGPVVRVGAEYAPHPCSRELEQAMIQTADDVLAAVEAAYGL